MPADSSSRATLPRTERLRGRAEFERLFRRGARLKCPSFDLLWIQATGRRAAAFAASRRLGGSVQRNRARRRLREAYRRQRRLVPATGLRLCFVARAAAADLPFGELVTQVAEALRQAGRQAAS